MGKIKTKKQLNYERNQRKKLSNMLKKANIEEVVDILSKKTSKGKKILQKLEQEKSEIGLDNEEKGENQKVLKRDQDHVSEIVKASDVNEYDMKAIDVPIDSAELIVHREISRRKFYEHDDENPSVTPPAEIHEELYERFDQVYHKKKNLQKYFCFHYLKLLRDIKQILLK